VTTVELIELEARFVAEQITLIEHENWKAIPTSEWLQKNYAEPEKSPNFANMANKFNEWGFWVLTEILKYEHLGPRAAALTLFIDVAKECMEMNNFNGCCAIIGALNNPAIGRLKATWEKMSKKTNSKFRKMMTFFDMTFNCKNYRDALKATKPPAVPYMALVPRDITSAEEIPTFVENGMCNFDKMRTIYKIVGEVQAFQKESYPFKVSPEFQHRLKTLKNLMSNDDAYYRSLALEARQID